MSEYWQGFTRGMLFGILITSVIVTAAMVWLAMEVYADIAPPLWEMLPSEVIA